MSVERCTETLYLNNLLVGSIPMDSKTKLLVFHFLIDNILRKKNGKKIAWYIIAPHFRRSLYAWQDTRISFSLGWLHSGCDSFNPEADHIKALDCVGAIIQITGRSSIPNIFYPDSRFLPICGKKQKHYWNQMLNNL